MYGLITVCYCGQQPKLSPTTERESRPYAAKLGYVSLEGKQLAENSTVYVQFLDNQMLLTGVRLNSPSHKAAAPQITSIGQHDMHVDVIRVDLSRSARDLA